MINCLKCINSGCCKLSIQISKVEYESLKPNVKKEFIKNIDVFLEKSPQFKGVLEKELEEVYRGNYAEMKKAGDGYCNLLDRKTMLCSVYEDRPQTCKDYTNNKCEKIRLLKDGI